MALKRNQLMLFKDVVHGEMNRVDPLSRGLDLNKWPEKGSREGMLNCIKHGSFDGSLNLVTVTAVDRAASSEHSSIDCESAKFPSPVRSKNRRCSVVDFSPECLNVHLNS
ncbi:hypothetical protein CAPTEDRAFT_185046 [Capitella teleta]|uniref:Uncharacterized protein n=1 Tax=Capitella teleta TaxID=283909 RepID=R7U012_CAPTE|nr:hypothetical protein CAPTEDRAFT_185046 [Capitella teleta]|eukprot:ELT99207.1 hypothetical protein CAPTEDRAFT_185046 [Capitella teleta]